MESARVPDYLNRKHYLAHFQSRYSREVRKRMFKVWLKSVGDPLGKRVLDVGVTPDTSLPDSNCWVPWFIEVGVELHLDSPENINHLKSVFPRAEIATTERDKNSIPVESGYYDWVVSSATLEHVGDRKAQICFLKELGRVAQCVFVTTPNRFHWLEFHTKLPFFHWLPRSLYRKFLKLFGMEEWGNENHLRLVGKNELLSLAQEALSSNWTLNVKSVWALGMESNLMLFGNRNA